MTNQLFNSITLTLTPFVISSLLTTLKYQELHNTLDNIYIDISITDFYPDIEIGHPFGQSDHNLVFVKSRNNEIT